MKSIKYLLCSTIFVIVVSVTISIYYTHTPKITLKSPLIKKATNILSDHFQQPIEITSINEISTPNKRNLVLRLFIKNQSPSVPASVILKQAIPQNTSSPKDTQKAYNNFARDWAGLAFVNSLLTTQPIAPHFYGGNTEYRFILLEDIGQPHISLADILTTKNNNEKATKSLHTFMTNLGILHGSSAAHTNEYVTLLTKINPDATKIPDPLIQRLNTLETTLKNYSIPITPRLQHAFDTVIQNITTPGPFTVFIHGDMCPDNTFDQSQQNNLLLIDFEKGRTSNALIDATYLKMNMPTCWCTGTLPNDVIESAESQYRQELAKHIPEAKNNDTYFTAYINACAFWLFQALLSIEEATKKSTNGEINLDQSRIISRLHSFIDVATKYNKLPDLVIMAETMLQKLNRQWPDVHPLPLFPAYNGNNHMTQQKIS